MGIEARGIGVLKRNRLRWECMCMEVEGARPRGRPRKAWLEVVKNDMKGLGLVQMLWRRKIVGDTIMLTRFA